MSDESNDNTQTAINAGMALSQIREVGGIPFIVLPGTGPLPARVERLDHLLNAPTRTKRTVKAHSLVGFFGYWNRHVKNPLPADANAMIYVDTEAHIVTAILDDDAMDQPGWRQHRMVYECPKSPEWKVWFGRNGNFLPQADFAAFIEQNMPDIADPPAADMLTISRSLEATRNASFGQSIRLENGESSLKYEETIDASAQKGALKIPDMFSLAIPVFLGGPTYKVDCRLRYRIPTGAGKGLAMGYEIDRPHVILDDAFQQIIAAITEGTSATVIEATPEK